MASIVDGSYKRWKERRCVCKKINISVCVNIWLSFKV